MKEGRKPEYPEKIPGDELQKMPFTRARRFKPQARFEPTQQHWRHARKADMLTFTPCVAPSIGGRLGKQTCLPLHRAWIWNKDTSVFVHISVKLLADYQSQDAVYCEAKRIWVKRHRLHAGTPLCQSGHVPVLDMWPVLDARNTSVHSLVSDDKWESPGPGRNLGSCLIHVNVVLNLQKFLNLLNLQKKVWTYWTYRRKSELTELTEEILNLLNEAWCNG